MIRIRVVDEFWYQKEYRKWCFENINNYWQFSDGNIGPDSKENWIEYEFKSIEDAVAFKLVWGGNII